MSLGLRDSTSRDASGWVAIGFRFGIGFFLAMVVCFSVSTALWMSILRLSAHESLDSAARQIGQTLDALPHPSLPQPSRPRSFKVDPLDRDLCLKLTNGQVNQQFLECMQENAATSSAP